MSTITTGSHPTDTTALSAAAQLLDRAVISLWHEIDALPYDDADALDRAELAWSLFRAHAHVASMLPTGHLVPDARLLETNPRRLGVAAEEMTRDLHVGPHGTPGAAVLVVSLFEVIRQASDLGY